MKETGRFNELSKEALHKLSSKGGQVKNPNKGFAAASKEDRKALARKAVNIRWAKYREEQERAKNG